MIEFSQREILRGKIVEPAWYRVSIDDYEKKMAAKGDSTNHIYEATIVQNSDNGDTKFVGVPLQFQFNSKAIGFMLPFFNAMLPEGEEVQAGSRFQEDAAKGKTIDVLVKNEEYDGRLINKVRDYRKPRVLANA